MLDREYEGWAGFEGGTWVREINLRSFINHNYTPYDGDETFLEGPTQDTKDLWEQVLELSKEEREKGGVLDMDTKVISTITSHGPGYLNKDKEKIVGFQTDKPFKRALMPYGGIRMAEKACSDNGYTVDPEISEFFKVHRKTHNAGVFDVYTPEMRACRSSHIITGLPDAYGRGRIIGDYRRVALYGVDRLIDDKEEQKQTTRSTMYAEIIRDREELSEQIRALYQLKEMAMSYGYDISKPDRHICRILGSKNLGCSDSEITSIYEAFDIVAEIAKVLEKHTAEVDYILWSYCANGYGEICTVNKPNCDICVGKENCNGRKEN